MAEKQSVIVVISGLEYEVSSNIEKDRLEIAVSRLNEYIEMTKIKTNGDELRATVLAALSFALNQTDLVAKNTEQDLLIDASKERLKTLVEYLDEKLEAEENVTSVKE